MQTRWFCSLLGLAACATAPTPASRPADALAPFAAAVAAAPEDEAALERLVEAAAAAGQLPQARALLAGRSDPLGAWFRGKTCFLIAETERAAGRLTEARAELDAALACFTAAAATPAYRPTSEIWIAMCLGKRGNVAFVAGDLAQAEIDLIDSVRRRPDCLLTDLGGGETTKLGLLRLGDRIMRDFARTERLFRAAVEAVGDDVDLLNNAAVYARDQGTRLARAGRAAEARTLFERSWATYLRAVAVDPTSVRLRNDCALVAVHHLKDQWDPARALLDRAIADGELALRESPPADAAARLELDEATGDAWENLALWHLEHGGDAAAARAAAQRSLEHFPHQSRSGARAHLAAAEQRLGRG